MDWYLPSTDELMEIREIASSDGTAFNPGTSYWSSTEDSNFNAFLVLARAPNNPLDTGAPSTSSKATFAYVIPVRSF